jgi:hypothetical protein
VRVAWPTIDSATAAPPILLREAVRPPLLKGSTAVLNRLIAGCRVSGLARAPADIRALHVSHGALSKCSRRTMRFERFDITRILLPLAGFALRAAVVLAILAK